MRRVLNPRKSRRDMTESTGGRKTRAATPPDNGNPSIGRSPQAEDAMSYSGNSAKRPILSVAMPVFDHLNQRIL